MSTYKYSSFIAMHGFRESKYKLSNLYASLGTG